MRCVVGVMLAAITAGCVADDFAPTTDATTHVHQETSDSSETETGGEPQSDLIEIPGATFMMGCGADDLNCDADNPEHEVTVSTFMIQRTEVWVGAYNACVEAGACVPTIQEADCNWGVPGRNSHPINCVTWQQAADFCEFMGRRLPTEAEWELAAAGPTARTYPWGSEPASCMLAHMVQVSGDSGGYGCATNLTAEVNSYWGGASSEGVLQLAGNVDEWVSDWYAEDYYASGETVDPRGPAEGTAKVVRGGDWYDASPLNLRAFERRQTPPNMALPERGFRCALSVE